MKNANRGITNRERIDCDLSGLEYEIVYETDGEGELSANDGVFRLKVSHGAWGLLCDTDEGVLRRELAGGAYHLSVRSGIAELSRNGHFEVSFRMPLNGGSMTVEAEGLSKLEVKATDGRRILARGDGAVDRKLEEVSQLWSLEFEKDGDDQEYIEVCDGGFRLQLYLGEWIVGIEAPFGGTGGQTQRLCRISEGRHLYRVVSVRGIARLFIDNRWAASLRLPASENTPVIRRLFTERNSLTILREEADFWTFSENFEDMSSNSPLDYWQGSAARQIISDGAGRHLLVSEGTAVLNGYLKNADIHARVRFRFGEEASGGIWLVCGYVTEDIRILAGYDLEAGRWEIRQDYLDEARILDTSEGNIPENEWLDMELALSDRHLSLLVNGALILSGEADYSVHGKVGICAEGSVSASLDEFRVSGDGRITAGIHEITNRDIVTSSFLEMKDGTVLMIGGLGGELPAWESSDSSYTFKKGTRTGFSVNTIRLQNGDIITVRRVAGEEKDTFWYDAFITSDEGITFSGPYRMCTIVRNRIAMQDKLMQTESGRIIFCGGESGHGKESFGVQAVYYSDDNGHSWHESRTSLDVWTLGVNVQEGVVAELPDGVLRCYMRTDRGFIYSTDSRDHGETWDTDIKKTAFPASMCAMNIQRDFWEKETYYMIWEYDNKSEAPASQFPRTRVALAVSYDGCENWEYVTDLSAWDLNVKGNIQYFRHMNEGIRIFKDYILADVVVCTERRVNGSANVNYIWRIDKTKIRAQKRFPLPYMMTYGTDGPQSRCLAPGQSLC